MRLSIMGLCADALFLGPICSVGAAEDSSQKEECEAKNSSGAQKHDCKDQGHPYRSFFLDNLELRATLGYTDIAGTERGGGAPVRLDREEAYSVEVGWFEKPAFDILLLLWGKQSYRQHKEETGKTNWCSNNQEVSLCSLFDDELKFNLGFGFGRTIVKKEKDNNGTSLGTTNKTYFNVGLSYSVPLDVPLEQLFFNSER